MLYHSYYLSEIKMNIFEIQLALPLVATFALILLLIILDAFTGKNKNINYAVSILGLIAVAVAGGYTLHLHPTVFINPDATAFFSKNMLLFGGYAAFFDIIFALAGILTMCVAKEYFDENYANYKEFYSMLIISIFGMMCIAHSNHMIILFLGIEVMSISFYVLTGYIRTRNHAVEGAMKYFLLGAFASGFLLYGIAMIYGATNALYYDEIKTAIVSASITPLYLKLGLGLLAVGIFFKIAAFPFHQWAADVYQAAPTPVSGFMSTAGKVAAIAAFVGISRALIPTDTLDISILSFNHSIQMLIALIAAATMIIGNITALVQKNIKRMLAYSSIGHAGYLLMGIVANNDNGFAGILYYAIAYTLTQVGAFAVVGAVEGKDETNLAVDSYSGLAEVRPVIAALMAMFMFSLAGIPPFAGFFGKYFLFKATIEAGYTWLTIIAVMTSIISVYYYLSIIIKMYFKEKISELTVRRCKLSKITLGLTAFGILFFGIFSYLIINFSSLLFR